MGLPGCYLVFMEEKKNPSGLLHQRRTLSALPDETHRGSRWHHLASSRKKRNGATFVHGSEIIRNRSSTQLKEEDDGKRCKNAKIASCELAVAGLTIWNWLVKLT